MGPFRLPDLHPADAILRERLASDASAAVHPDAAVDAALPALTAWPYAEKLAVQGLGVQAPAAERHRLHSLPVKAKAPYRPDAARFAA